MPLGETPETERDKIGLLFPADVEQCVDQLHGSQGGLGGTGLPTAVPRGGERSLSMTHRLAIKWPAAGAMAPDTSGTLRTNSPSEE